MRILSMTAQKPDSTGSGVYLTELVKCWAAMGHRQAVVAGVYREDVVSLPEGVDFYPVTYGSERLPYPILGMSDTMPYESTRYRDLTEEQADQFEQAFHEAAVRAVEELKPDRIICHHLYYLTALVRKWFPDIPVFGVCHGTDLRQLSQIPFKGSFIRESIRGLNGIMALHEAQKQEIQRIFSCPAEQIRVVGAGYNDLIFNPKGKTAHPGKQIAFAGKVCEKKGIFSLIGALDRLSYPKDSLTVKIAGGYKEKEEYEKIQRAAEKCQVPIAFLGAVPQARLADLFRESDLFVLPSFFEGLPLVTLEAMACGCRVVCSDIPGMAAWFAENVPGHQTEFVPLPTIRNVDEPVQEELPAFEERLAAAMDRQLEKPAGAPVDLRNATWDGISRKILG